MYLRVIIGFVAFFSFWSCSSNLGEQIETINEEIEKAETSSLIDGLKALEIPSDFNFETSMSIDFEIDVKSLKNKSLSGVKVSFYTADPDQGGEFIASGFTDDIGKLVTKVHLPTYVDEVFVQVHTVGFANQQTVTVNPNISLVFGGIPEVRAVSFATENGNTPSHISDNFYYMGDYSKGDVHGLPAYLEPQGDDLSQAFLNDVKMSLPEHKPVPTFNPQYLATGNELDVVVNDVSDVWSPLSLKERVLKIHWGIMFLILITHLLSRVRLILFL